jgi:Uma2 family endonuclease
MCRACVRVLFVQEDLERKIDQYLAAGAIAIWVIYPQRRRVHVFAGTRTGLVLGEDDCLEFPRLLPGFSLPIRRLFER